ncbi:hypothetical protein PQC11_gp008 [Synechococcus phage S-H9-1]|uniref:Uncharacterized protein n=1 Tax=Synechococcus phage S-H9-1 TaxID=2783674 RepID=A0A873WFD2_9CAUD|nr:hypothetical protein PQC11_gp008 [Synechococcus phage S-H9-1]QPB08056.1 hypothetical protein [Synechococcus phage S-H9-1]
MIEVTQEDDNTFTISWDENDPQERMFNTWTEEDFINAIQDKLKALEELGVLDNATEAVNQINDHIEEEIIATCEETFGEECYEKDTTLHEFIDQTAEELFEDISNAEKFTDWYSVKEEAIREYQSDELKEDGDVPPPNNFPLFP